MGHGYKKNPGHYHSVIDNLPALISNYEYKSGYFGCRGKGRNFVRNIYSNNPIKTARDFYGKIALGGIEKKLENGKGFQTSLKDGTIISFRAISSSDGTPVVEINIRKSNTHGDLKRQKIHFVKGCKI